MDRNDRPRRWRAAFRAFLVAFLVAGCAVGPDYRNPPEVSVGDGWTLPVTSDAPDPALATWWQSLGDPTLTQLVERALSGNIDARIAVARIAEARALLAATSARSLPTVTGGGVVAPLHQGVNGPLPLLGSRDSTIYAVGFDASWEIDLFGGVQRATESASARVQALQEDAVMVRLSVAAEVARTYVALRGAQMELAARLASIDTLVRAREIAGRRLARGDAAPADVNAAQSRLDAALAGVPAIEARARNAALAIGTLLGGLPESELALLQNPGPTLVILEMPVGQRADILRRRPDIRSAERRLAASSADIGVATANLFPRLSITALGGFTSLNAGSLFLGDSLSGVVAPLLSWRVFDGGRIRAEINAAEARQQIAALAYEGAVINAIGDAERALNQYRFAQRAFMLQRDAVESVARDYANAQVRRQRGDIGIVEQLDAERQLREAQEGLARAQTGAALDLVGLYKALGGGWDTAAGPP